MTPRLLPLALLTALVALLAGCGGDKDAAALEKSCPNAPAAMKNVPKLPGDFPTTNGLVYTGIKQAGPSTIVAGYIASAIGDAHTAVATSVKNTAGYNVTKDELDKADAEINFSSNGNSGQAKLVQTCRARTNVTITIRPA
jgi:hypothetical protein